jgi:threonine/homoserine/homoserine lactone efflux protein
MLTHLAWILGVLTLGLLSPGPDFFLVVKNSLGGSRARALGTVAGIAVGLAVQGAVIALGFVAAPPALLRTVQLAGAVFLGYLGVRAFFAAAEHPPEAGAPVTTALGARSGFIQGLLCNLTNPKAFLFFVSLYAQIVRPGAATLWRIGLPALIVGHALVAWSLVVFAVQSPPVERRLLRAQHWLPRAFGCALLALAAWTGWQVWRG